MSLHCAFLFPKKQFRLIFMSTIGYISDNMFYRLNLETGQTEIQMNPHGRSYQAFTANHKRGLVVLADYGKNPNVYFDFLHKKQNSFQMKDICTLQILKISLSLDCKYLLVCSGIPEKKIFILDIQNKKVLNGSESFINVGDRTVLKTQFNPANNKIFAVMFDKQIQVYQIVEQFKHSEETNQLEQLIKIYRKCTISSQSQFEAFQWDEINNIYASNGKYVFVYSTDTEKEVINYELEGDFDKGHAITNFILTPKHLILVYQNGRLQWILKYYPDLMEQQQLSKKPFYLQKYYEFSRPINCAIYDHMFTKIFIAHKNGLFSVINKSGQSHENEEEEEQNKAANQGNQQRNKKLDLEVLNVGPYHANQIMFCKQVKGKAILVTMSNAGKIIFWSILQKKAITFLETGFETLSADVNNDFTLLCVSNRKGIVRFYSISDFTNIFLVRQFKLVQKHEINEVRFSSNCQQIACLSTGNKKVFYILNLETDLQILGYVNLPYTPYSICWNSTTKTLVKPKYEHLLCCIGFGILMINSPAAVSVKARGKQFELNAQIFALRTDLDQKYLAVLPSGQILSTGADKILKKYKQPEDPISKFNPQIKTPIPAPIEEFESHDLQTTFMKIQGKSFISGGADGTLQIRPIDNFNNIKNLKVYGWKNSNLNTGGISQYDGLYYVCGKDGSLAMWKTKDLQIQGSDEIKKQKSKFNKIKSIGDSLKLYQNAIEDEFLQRMKDSIVKKKKDQLDKITKIKVQLRQLLQQNKTHDELERLSRDEFVIDLQLRDKVTKVSVQNCEKIKKQSNKKVLYNEVYRNKLKQITWDQMKQHLRAINGLKNNYMVYNYQIKKVGQEEKRKLQLVMDLRRNQIKQMKKKDKQVIDVEFYKNKNIINGGLLQPLILTVLQKKDDKKDDKAKKKKEEQVAEKQPEEVEQVPKEEVWQLLYSSFELYSDNAKKNQIILMRNVIIKIKQAFNKQFNKLLKYRQNQNEMINDKNKRIIQICEQLKRSHEVIVSNKNILENPDKILEVDTKEIPFSRYLSREERQKLQKERLKQEERLRALAEDDSSQRALQKMMGGTLEEKKTSVLEVTVEREKWMDKPIQQMSQEQKNKLKQFEQKRQKAQEQKERIVKKLEAELRKLKLEIDDIMQKYDQKLFGLLRRRIEYDLRIQQQQLYCIKLSLSIANFDQQSERCKQIKNKQVQYQNRIQLLQNQRNLLKSQQEQLQKVKQQKKMSLDMKRLGEMETKVKTIQKTVYQEYHSNIKKRKQFQAKLLQSDPISKYQIISLDPMKELQSKALSNQSSQQFKFFLPEIKAMQQTYDFPDSLYTVLESRFNIRKQQGQLERKLKGLRESLKKLQQNIINQQAAKEADHKQIQTIQKQLQQSKSDLQIQFRIKKGLVEIDSQTPVPKLNDALLISKSEIDEKNTNIIQKAELKIQVMEQIKTCKISVTQQTLQLQRKQSLIDEYSSRIKEVQMLKVKKQMQTALAKKDTKINENQLRSLKQQIQKVRKQGEKRIQLFEKKIQKVNQQIDAIKKQNKQLEVQKWNLQNTVKQRQKIKDMMVGEKGQGNQEAAQKFQQISVNRKLFDKAKQQTDQIQLLRQQLSKLKAKTFANFSSVQR